MEFKYGDRIKIKEWNELPVDIGWNEKFFQHFGGEFGRITKINYVSTSCVITLDRAIEIPDPDQKIKTLHVTGKDFHMMEKHIDLPQELFEI